MPTIPILTRYRRLKRYRRIVTVLAKHGFGEFVSRLRLWGHTYIEGLIFRHYHEIYPPAQTPPVRLRLAFEELGCTFIKLGQVLSTRPDLLPQDFITELEKLQNNVPPISTQAAKKVIESELGRPLFEVFSSFDDEPLAAASLAQVHKARLKQGDIVAVKVQRPEAEKIVKLDLDIMHRLAMQMERRFPEALQINATGLVREFASNLKKELDLRIEANSMSNYAHNFTGDTQIHIPTVYYKLCTRRVLVMEYVEGINISDVKRLTSEGYDLSLIAKRNLDILLRSTLEYGFFHADPHPGNLLVLPDNVICLLDFGMMGYLSRRQRESLARLAYGISSGDEKLITRSLLGLTEQEGVINIQRVEADISQIYQQYLYLPSGQARLGPALFDMLQLLMNHNIRFNPQLVWLFKALATAEGTTHRLNVILDVKEYLKPFAGRLLKQKLNPLHNVRELPFIAADTAEAIKNSPYEIIDFLRLLKEGNIRMKLEHVGVDPTNRMLNRVANRIVFVILAAALFIGSSLIVLADLPPLVASIPIISLIGFIVAGALLVWLVISIAHNSGP